MQATITKIKDARPVGEYVRTEIDDRKDAADFRIVQVGPYYIQWRDGRIQKVTERQLRKFQAEHPNWMTDF